MNLLSKKWAKVTSLILAVGAIVVFIGTIFSIGSYQSLDMAYRSKEDVKKEMFENRYYNDSYEVFNEYFEYNYLPNDGEYPTEVGRFSQQRTNYLFEAYNAEKELLISNAKGVTMAYPVEMIFSYQESEDSPEIVDITIISGINPKLAVWDAYKIWDIAIDFLSLGLVPLVGIVLASIFVVIISLRFFIRSVGVREGVAGITMRLQDKVPLELVVSVYWVAGAILFSIISERGNDLLTILVFMSLICLLMLEFFISIVIRIKTRTLLSNTLVFKMVLFIRTSYQNFPVVRKGMAVFIIYSFIEFIVVVPRIGGFATVFWFVKTFVFAYLLMKVLVNMKEIETAGAIISQGNVDYRMSEMQMIPLFREHAHHLNQISSSVSRAVDEQMKSERMKTELITNVSHDIKTPLTSILNYVDLLSKEDLGNEVAYSYLEPLKRQSLKLAKLVDDLLVASRINSGNAELAPEVMKLNVFVSQTAGEFLDRLSAKNLSLIISGVEEDVEIFADSQYMSRTLDNLLINVLNYSLENTRVYLSLVLEDNTVSLVIRNISKEPLDIEETDLLERFVRGDSSRNTEGNGLGLSIAKSMVEAQGGSFSLMIDGDLFKVVCTFPLHE